MATTLSSNPVIRLAAVGDLLLAPWPEGTPSLRDPGLVSPEIRDVFAGCGVVFANLECTLPGDGRCVATEPRVICTAELVRAVKATGIGVVSLANNHGFDCFEGGFQNLRGVLDEIGLPHFGAGMNLDEATAPALLQANGLRLAFLGAVDQRSGAQQFATPNQWGVAPLDVDGLIRQIRDLRSDVDHVLVSVHWGEERFLIPSPAQIDQAHALIDAGASMVIGHHPHVLQGLEMRNGAPIVYSLGNFFADEMHFADGGVIRWNRTGRTGAILLAELSRDSVLNVRQQPTYDSGHMVELDQSGFGQRRIAKTGRAVARGVSLARYRREYLYVKILKPIVEHLRWSQLSGLRPRHFWNALRGILRMSKAN
ncbi:MAG: CapA family protein [Pirellulales bacterium]|nr:CapA family protein [Pirellulales bacterium]